MNLHSSSAKQLGVAVALALAWASSSAASGTAGAADPGIVSQVMSLYGLTEEAAIDRLAREEAANDVLQLIEAEQMPGYAGAWFDEATLSLKVAVAEGHDGRQARALGAAVVEVPRSLERLKSVAARLEQQVRSGTVTGYHIDPRSNSVVAVAKPGRGEAVRAEVLRFESDPHAIQVEEREDEISFAGPVLAADGTRNLTWAAQTGLVHPCSVGAPIDGGFISAGHCYDTNDSVGNTSNTVIGTVGHAQYNAGYDIGWVSTQNGAYPISSLNGYSNGTLTIPAKWSGVQKSALNTTACRYGQTSGGPHCGTISAVGATRFINGFSFSNVTDLSGTCVSDGDSGGPLAAASSIQMQGTLIGGTRNSCPSTSTTAYFQPVTDHLAWYGKIMLTAHGAAAPTTSGYACPDMGQSGAGAFVCKIDYYNSQGDTTVRWKRGTTNRYNTQITGTCSANQWVAVELYVTNPYGTYSTNSTFLCPTGGIN